MNVVVTGGAGFIGAAVVRRLAEDGHHPIVFDRADGFDIVNGRIPHGDAVIHLAGVLGTSELFNRAREAVDVNVLGTLNVLEACAEHGMSYVGITMPAVWANAYQATKTCAMQLAEAWGARAGFPVAHIRAFNVYGPGQKVHGVQKLIPTFAHLSWRGLPMPVWGSGLQMVDLVHVDDVADLLCRWVGQTGTVEAGSGVGTTVLDVARMVGDVTGSSVVEFLPMRAGETTADGVVSKEPWLTHLKGVKKDPRFRETVEWYKDDRP